MNKTDLAESRKATCIWGDICPDNDDCEFCPYYYPCKPGAAADQYENDVATQHRLEWVRAWWEANYEDGFEGC